MTAGGSVNGMMCRSRAYSRGLSCALDGPGALAPEGPCTASEVGYGRGQCGARSQSGNSTTRWTLPADEEVFESLAARLRPLTVAKEPIHYKKVFRAIEERAALTPARLHQRAAEFAASNRFVEVLDGSGLAQLALEDRIAEHGQHHDSGAGDRTT